MRRHEYHVVTLRIGYTERLLGSDIPHYTFDDNLDSDDEDYMTKFYPGGEVTGVKYPVLKRLYSDINPAIEHASILYIGSKNPTFQCADASREGVFDNTKEHYLAQKIHAEVSKLTIYNDIAVVFNYKSADNWEPANMGIINGFIESLMQLNHCAMFSFDTVFQQYDYEIIIDGNIIKCLHIHFDTESG